MKVNGGWIFSWYEYFGYLLTQIFFGRGNKIDFRFSLHEIFPCIISIFKLFLFPFDTSLATFPHLDGNL